MKINWGTGLVIGMVLFMAFIMYFVIKISTEKKYDYDLVTEEYYKKEMVYQKEIDAEENSNSLSGSISGEKTEAAGCLTFPENLIIQKLQVRYFYIDRPTKNLIFSSICSFHNKIC